MTVGLSESRIVRKHGKEGLKKLSCFVDRLRSLEYKEVGNRSSLLQKRNIVGFRRLYPTYKKQNNGRGNLAPTMRVGLSESRITRKEGFEKVKSLCRIDYAVWNTKRSGIQIKKSSNQRYECLWAFPQINAECAFGILRV